MRNLFGWYALGVGVGGLGGYAYALSTGTIHAGWLFLLTLCLFVVFAAYSLGPALNQHLRVCTGHWHFNLLDLLIVSVLLGFAFSFRTSAQDTFVWVELLACFVSALAFLAGLLFASQRGLYDYPLRQLYALGLVARVASILWTAGCLVYLLTCPIRDWGLDTDGNYFYETYVRDRTPMYWGMAAFGGSELLLAFVDRMCRPVRKSLQTRVSEGRFHTHKGVTRRRFSG